ncbi:gastrula zinc finger protein XlCGF8.2DB-like [Pungitius pungitius]|uniref:gastrula zinc finger protein XlCGF8.2DB-like n=1 Tax=Pungitius pungitius TaxID=134920 RepID=UPI002E107B1D
MLHVRRPLASSRKHDGCSLFTLVVFIHSDVRVSISFVPPELPQSRVCKQEEVLSDQQLCLQERNPSVDQEDPDPPQIKEEQEELCSSQEGEQLEPKQEADTFTLTPTCEETHHSDDETPFLNPDKSQSESEAPPGEKTFLSKTRGKYFQHKENLSAHVRTAHKVDQRYLCSTCGKTFTAISHLKTHTRIHTGERPYPCITCGKKFTQGSALKSHTRVHTGEKPYSCITCGKTFTQASVLKSHTRIHTGEKPYSCITCGKAFTHRSQLRCHISNHAGEKPYSCITCGKTFAFASHLKSHTRVHTGEKPYSCITCGKAFTHRSQLRCHISNHAGEKPYSCITCGKTFAFASHLKSHTRVHNGRCRIPVKYVKKFSDFLVTSCST